MIRLRLTDKQVKEALKALTIQIDTREQKEHIEAYFTKHKIPFKRQKLDRGDFSAFIPAGTIKGIEYDLSFDKYVVIERKKSIDELAGNFSSKDYPRISKEFAHLKAAGTKVIIMLEDQLFDKHLRAGNYRSAYDPKTLYARLKGFEAEYDTFIRPINKEFIGSEIYHTLYYEVRNLLLREFKLEMED